jgi:hypothetical protein
MAVQFYIQSKENSLGKHSVYARIRTADLDLSIPTKISVLQRDWDKSKRRIKATSSIHPLLNAKLTEHKERLYDAYDLFRAGAISKEDLIQRVKSKKTSSLFTLLETYRIEKKPKTYSAYRTAVNAFTQALGLEEAPFESVNHASMSSCISKWKKTHSPTTINNYLRHLSIIMRDANRRGLTTVQFELYKSYFQRISELEVKSITKEAFTDAVQRATTKLEKDSLILFLLSYASRGLYFEDIITMKPKKGVFTHIRTKTGNRMAIDGLDGLIKELHSRIDVSELTEARRGKYQRTIKRLLGVPFKCARKTFDSYAVLGKVDYQVRIHLLGQRDSSIKRYYTNFQMKELQAEVNKAHRSVVYSFNCFESATALLAK